MTVVDASPRGVIASVVVVVPTVVVAVAGVVEVIDAVMLPCDKEKPTSFNFCKSGLMTSFLQWA